MHDDKSDGEFEMSLMAVDVCMGVMVWDVGSGHGNGGQ